MGDVEVRENEANGSSEDRHDRENEETDGLSENQSIAFSDWQLYFDRRPRLCRVPPANVVLPLAYVKNGERLREFEARDDDVWVVTFPKSGTTWMQQIVMLIVDGCQRHSLTDQRFPFFEADVFYSTSIRGSEDVLKTLSRSSSPRLIKSHLPINALPDDVHKRKCKIIYVARNPKDVVVSLYHFEKMLTTRGYKGDLSTFIKHFIEDKVIYAPYWSHILNAWSRREENNILFVHYENLQKDLLSEVKRICSFLGRCLNDEDLNRVCECCSFDAMKTNPAANKEYWKEEGRWKKNGTDFLRKGQVGDWVNYFSTDDVALIDEWIDKNSANSDLKFEYCT